MRCFASAVVLVLAISGPGCATGEDNRWRLDVSGVDGGPRADTPTTECTPPCPSGYACESGTCVPASDVDGDGVPSDRDCDDASASVGSMAERLCTSACAEGIERCTDGRWAPCSAPTTCDCRIGDAPRMVPCMSCGMQRQVCDAGIWRNDGTCSGAGSCSMGEVEMGAVCGRCGVQARTCGLDCTWGAWTCAEEGVCTTGMMEMESQMCGACGTGTQTRTRTCDGTCGWGPWSGWSTCSGGDRGVCMPGETEMEMGTCGNCDLGRRTRSRSCDVAAGCVWGPWSGFGACSGGGTCAPGATMACSPADSCGHRVCNGSCNWGACEPRTPAGCLRIRPGTSGPEGNNYRCCTRTGSDPTGWQFCLPTCSWSTACDASTAC